MSRRFLFLLAATVVVLYFSVILLMLNPLHVRGTYSIHFPMRQPSVRWCKELHWRAPPSPDVVALVSYPGSGNTWLRYLLQQVTGMVTGSIYMDHGLRMHGFPAENVSDGSVLVVKTHELPPLEPHKFKSAILLIRNPRDSFLADFNWRHRGHIGTAPKWAFERKPNEQKKTGAGMDWASYVSSQMQVWEELHRAWLTRFTGPLLVVQYDALVRDTKRELQGILHFLNYNVTEMDMTCALAFKEGIYRRKKKLRDFDPFTADMYDELDNVKKRVFSLVADYRKRQNETPRQDG